MSIHFDVKSFEINPFLWIIKLGRARHSWHNDRSEQTRQDGLLEGIRLCRCREQCQSNAAQCSAHSQHKQADIVHFGSETVRERKTEPRPTCGHIFWGFATAQMEQCRMQGWFKATYLYFYHIVMLVMESSSGIMILSCKMQKYIKWINFSKNVW